MPANKVVVHYLDGRLLKGATADFAQGRPSFHVLSNDGGTVEVQVNALKAVFFVREFAGGGSRAKADDAAALPAASPKGKKVAVLFQDGELLCGYTLTYTPGRPTFFLLPVNPDDNNERIFVVATSAKAVAVGAETGALIGKVLEARANPQPV